MIVLSDLDHFAADSDEEISGDLDAVSKSADIPFITKKAASSPTPRRWCAARSPFCSTTTSEVSTT